jgi:hypothetical protein
MTMGKKNMKPLDEEIARIDAEIERLKAVREGIILAKNKLGGIATPPPQARRRSANVKPVVLDIMARAEAAGATSAEVMERVKEKVPTVAKDTVGSTLSRLKADGALTYNGERYYDARFAPKAETLPFEPERIIRRV